MLHRALPFVIVLCAPAAHAGTQRCDALPEKWEQTHDKAACYIATDDAAAIPKLLAVAKKASAWRTVEAPAAANDDDVIWRETFYFAAEGAGKLAAASGSATLVDFARSRDVDTQRFGIRGLAAMLDQLIGDDRARYERERVKVMPICLTKLAASEPRIQSDALALCIARARPTATRGSPRRCWIWSSPRPATTLACGSPGWPPTDMRRRPIGTIAIGCNASAPRSQRRSMRDGRTTA